MTAGDVTDTALKASGCDQTKIVHRPRLLSDHGSSYIAGDLASWLGDRNVTDASLRLPGSEPSSSGA
jgi:putative transposase